MIYDEILDIIYYINDMILVYDIIYHNVCDMIYNDV